MCSSDLFPSHDIRVTYKNGVPLLLYLDIFKNFFANTQEKKFYMLKGIGEISFEVIDSYENENEGHFIIGKDNTKTIKITNSTKLDASITTDDYQSFWNSINAKVLNSKGTVISKSLAQLTSNATTKKITLDNIDADPFATILLKLGAEQAIVIKDGAGNLTST